jgi:isoquinoline 1-oxidoreductase beta subunit
MLTAVVARPPVFGGSSRGVRNESEILAMPGVRKVKTISNGVAVLAETFWQAKRACDRLDVDWDDGPNAKLSTEELYERYARLAQTPGAVAELQGDPDARLASAKEVVEATFLLPYLAHAPMEPLNATAHVREGEAEVWTGSYLQTANRGAIAHRLGLPPEKVQLHTMLAGGAFGRRATLDADFLMDAVEAAQGEGVPVKAVWQRPDDIRGGKYRALAVHRVEAALGRDGLPDAWRQRVVTQSIAAGTPFEPFMVHEGVDHTSVEGASMAPNADYSSSSLGVPHRRVELHSPEVGITKLWFRSVGHTHTAFAGEHFLDILARKAGRDPVEYRRTLLAGGDPRLLGVLELAAEKSGWGGKLLPGRARGVALRRSFGAYVCQVFECSLADDGAPVTHKVTCAVDVGIAVNPWNIEQQVQGAIAYAMTAALYGAIDIENGRVRQSNFHDYRILRMHEMPEIDVHIVPSRERPSGIGEPGVPPVAPAMANAKLALTGEPTYRLPFVRREGRG